MSVQSRRKPSRLLAATVWGLIWAFALCIIGFFVHGTVQEIRNQAGEGFARSYVPLYIFPLFVSAVIAICRTGGVEASKRLYLTVQLVNFTVFLWVFWFVLHLADGNGLAFFLGNPEPGVFSTYEALYILLLCGVGLPLLSSSVINDKHRNEIRIGVSGILFTIGIFLPNMLSSFALLKATCSSRLPEAILITAQCQAQAIGTIPMFTMAIAFSAALAVLFFLTLLPPAVARFISRRTGDGTNARESGSLSDSLESAQTQQNLPGQEPETAVQPSYAEPLPSAVRRNNHFGNFTAAVFGGVVVWAIQAIGERATKRR